MTIKDHAIIRDYIDTTTIEVYGEIFTLEAFVQAYCQLKVENKRLTEEIEGTHKGVIRELEDEKAQLVRKITRIEAELMG